LKIGFFWKNVSGGFFDGKRFRRHTSPFAIRGVPDVLGIVNGKFIGLEIKTITGKTSEHQDAWARKAQDCGALVGVVRSIGETQSLLRAWELIS
jgi:hypothetical protein